MSVSSANIVTCSLGVSNAVLTIDVSASDGQSTVSNLLSSSVSANSLTNLCLLAECQKFHAIKRAGVFSNDLHNLRHLARPDIVSCILR